MHEAMLAVGRSHGPIKRKISTWAKDIGLRGTHLRMNGCDSFLFLVQNVYVEFNISSMHSLTNLRYASFC